MAACTVHRSARVLDGIRSLVKAVNGDAIVRGTEPPSQKGELVVDQEAGKRWAAELLLGRAGYGSCVPMDLGVGELSGMDAGCFLRSHQGYDTYR